MQFKSLLLLASSFVGLSWAGTFSQVQNFGSNPSGAKMYVYTPTNIASNPPIIVSIHFCTGTAQAMYTGTPYARYADQYGYIVIYPESPYSGRCWDVASPQTLKRDGGANSNSIANMVKYAIQTYRADAGRVYVQGASSGAMMTNVLAATYPDLFAAAIVYSGVPAGCFAVPNSLPSSPSQEPGWNSNCSGGRFIQTPQQWADTAKAMYPGYTGRRPRMQIYHGDADTTLSGNNYAETMKQWSAIFGYTYGSPQQTLPNTPVSPYTKQIYGPNLEGILGRGIGHNVANMGLEDLKWFGIVGGSSPTTTAPPTTRPTTTSTSTSAPPATTGQPQWAQCGGNGWTGGTTCVSPFTCKVVNEWYHQCQ